MKQVMKLLINGQEEEYTSDYPAGWKFSAGDPFKFPVLIGSRQCFVKRFETKTPESISGWKLLQSLRGKTEPSLPRVLDIKEVVEEESAISYVFYEYLEGTTLEEALRGHTEVNLRRITYDIFNALASVHRYGFWVADFCEKNIFCETNGRYVLMDLDSTQPLTVLPDNEMWGSKDYWIPVYKFYKEILDQPNIRHSAINGMGLDYLQFIFMILYFRLYEEGNVQHYKSEENFNLLVPRLSNLGSDFKNLFLDVLQQGSALLSADKITAIRNLMEEKIINNTMNFNSGTAGAVIHQFSSSTEVVRKGESFILSWNADADKIELYRNGALFQSLGAAQQSIERTDFYDSDKDVTYQLVAYKSGITSKSKPLVIRLISAAPSGALNAAMSGHLLSAAAWARFIAIVGLVCCILAVLVMVAVASSKIARSSEVMPITGLVLLFIVSVPLFPIIFLFRFANKMKSGLARNDTAAVTDSLKNVKNYFVYVGVLSIIFLLISLFALVVYNN